MIAAEGKRDPAGQRYVVGLMSGTSVDGIDAALVRLAGPPGEYASTELIAFTNVPFPLEIREEIFALFDVKAATLDRVGRLNVGLGELYAEAALKLVAKAGLAPSDVAVIGSHGQTIWHAPELIRSTDGRDFGFTVQLGEGAVIAARTGIPCVTDFRAADMAVGGQGAPLVPFTEYLLYREPQRTLLLQNIGGIGNVTVLPAGCFAEEVTAFDTGPGNMLIDGLVSRLYPGELTMDLEGQIAGKGNVSESLLDWLKQEEYYQLVPPKSTGREKFGAHYLNRIVGQGEVLGLSAEDMVATATYLTAWTIGYAYQRFIQPMHRADEMIVGGGGSYNPVLMNFLKRELASMGVKVSTQEDAGWNSDAKEAIAFALLADCALAGIPGNIPSVTGASRRVVLGKISY